MRTLSIRRMLFVSCAYLCRYDALLERTVAFCWVFGLVSSAARSFLFSLLAVRGVSTDSTENGRLTHSTVKSLRARLVGRPFFRGSPILSVIYGTRYVGIYWMVQVRTCTLVTALTRLCYVRTYGIFVRTYTTQSNGSADFVSIRDLSSHVSRKQKKFSNFHFLSPTWNIK
jgi:hypothetical protein